MTDRHCGYVVALDKNIREDDAAETIAAIKQIKGVMNVKPILGDSTEMVATMRARNDVITKLLDLVNQLNK